MEGLQIKFTDNLPESTCYVRIKMILILWLTKKNSLHCICIGEQKVNYDMYQFYMNEKC